MHEDTYSHNVCWKSADCEKNTPSCCLFMFTNFWYSQMEKYHSKSKEQASFSQTGNHSQSGDQSQKHTQSLSKSQLPKEVVFHSVRPQKQTHHHQDLIISSKHLLTSICSFKVLRNTTVCVVLFTTRDSALVLLWSFTRLHTFHYL